MKNNQSNLRPSIVLVPSLGAVSLEPGVVGEGAELVADRAARDLPGLGLEVRQKGGDR